ncbi:MAG: N-formylglutamate amidohydrolase [Myxococcaceae bacterium]|nr:N-formylglutamate amidohydrolase [Myxococcaceae bacterium]
MLLQAGDPAPFEVLNERGRSPFLLTCDHAGCSLPRQLGDLGVAASELRRHIAWDLGVAELGRALALKLDAFLILQTYSRLAIDVNRPLGTPESIVTLSERTAIPGNVDLTEDARRARELAIFVPYHERIEAELERRRRVGGATVLVALHSFTPTFKDVARRWHSGILYGRDARLARPMLAYLQREPGLVVGDNEPYAVSEETDYTVVVHAERRGIPYVEIEVRQDLLADPAGHEAWALRLAGALEHSFSELFPL